MISVYLLLDLALYLNIKALNLCRIVPKLLK